MQKEIRSLTGLRGAAALLVVLHHFFSGVDTGPFNRLLGNGYLSVDLFFVLSGFVMALTYGHEFANGVGLGAYFPFLYKRLARVYPLYLVVTLVCTGLAILGVEGQPIPSPILFIENLFLIQSWGFGESIDGPGWSISTEMACYILFPVLLLANRNRLMSNGAFVLSLGILIFIATRTSAELHQIYGGTEHRRGPLQIYICDTPYPLLRCFAGFTLGLLSFKAWRTACIARILSKPIVGDALVAVAIVLITVTNADVLEVILFGAIIVALATEKSFSARLLRSRVLHWLGLISYSLYLVHEPLINFTRGPLQAIIEGWRIPHAYTICGIIVLPLAIGLAALSYYFIEMPARDLSRKLANTRCMPILAKPALSNPCTRSSRL